MNVSLNSADMLRCYNYICSLGGEIATVDVTADVMLVATLFPKIYTRTDHHLPLVYCRIDEGHARFGLPPLLVKRHIFLRSCSLCRALLSDKQSELHDSYAGMKPGIVKNYVPAAIVTVLF